MIRRPTQKSGMPSLGSSSRGRALRFKNPFAWHRRKRNSPGESASLRRSNPARNSRVRLWELPGPADTGFETRTVERANLHFDDQSLALLDSPDEVEAR